MKKCPTFLAIKEMQIKTTLRFHLIPVRVAILKSINNKYCQGWGMEEEPSSTVGGNVGMQISTTAMKSSMEVPQKLNMELPWDPAIPLHSIYPKEC
jgi:hypothetical protein